MAAVTGGVLVAAACSAASRDDVAASNDDDGGIASDASLADTTTTDGAVDARKCPAGQDFCGGRCIDVTQDDENCGACATSCTGGAHCAEAKCTASKIEHVVLIVQENHSFDSYFGRYCQAPAGSAPTCTDGRACCERAPDTEPGGATPLTLDDASNFAKDRDHEQACEVQQIHGGAMDRFVTGATGASTCLGSGPSCSSPENFGLAQATTVGTYWTYADNGALADRWFQPIAGGSSSNDMYFATSHFQFVDNTLLPKGTGSPKNCAVPSLCIGGTETQLQGTTIADLLLAAGKDFAVYADGLAEAKAVSPTCPSAPAACPYANCISHPIACYGCMYDASDIPFAYFAQFAEGPHLKDYASLKTDLSIGRLPAFSYVKARAFHNEHPNVSTITDGAKFVKATVDAVLASSAADSTLILVTWDEGGGFFDHVPPPPGIDDDPESPIHPIPYGTRVPTLAIGPFAKKGHVSHVTMEHSSVVRFLEYNFIGPTGQLGVNDAKVHNIGSLLDPTATGIVIPD